MVENREEQVEKFIAQTNHEDQIARVLGMGGVITGAIGMVMILVGQLHRPPDPYRGERERVDFVVAENTRIQRSLNEANVNFSMLRVRECRMAEAVRRRYFSDDWKWGIHDDCSPHEIYALHEAIRRKDLDRSSGRASFQNPTREGADLP